MSLKKIKKFENPQRISELTPEALLSEIGVNRDSIICDIGAGTGVFAIPAAQITQNKVYALDIEKEMIELLNQRKIEFNLSSLEPILVKTKELPISSETCDFALMITVLHELDTPLDMLQNIKDILKKDGKLLIVDFHKEKTAYGPPIEHRLDENTVVKWCESVGLNIIKRIRLGDNFYSILVSKI